MSDIRIVKGELRFKSASDVDSTIDVNLNQLLKEQTVFDRNVLIDLAILFDKERQASTIIRPSFKITFITENAYTGTTNYTQFKNNLFYVNNEFYVNQPNPSSSPWGGFPQYNEFDLIRTDYDVIGYTEPPNQHITFSKKSAFTYNWNFFISYAHKNLPNRILEYTDNQYPLLTSPFQWTAKDGIPFVITNIVNVGENLISFRCPIKHNLNVSEYIQLSNPAGSFGDIFQVYSLGDGTFGSEEYVFNIFNYGYATNAFNNATQGTFKRILNLENSGETMSKYYVRENKILTNFDDAILNYCGFENNIFGVRQRFDNSALTPDIQAKIITKENDRTYTINFSKDIDILSLVDNQKRPITELFLTIVHKGYFGWFYDPSTIAPLFYNSLKRGYEFNLPLEPNPLNVNPNPDLWWNNSNTLNRTNIPLLNYTNGNNVFYYNQSLKTGDTIDGDFCEWNDYEQREYVLSSIYHKYSFNMNNFDIRRSCCQNSDTKNPFGYFYKPHHKLQIREFSPYVETGDKYQVDNVPGYAFYSQYTNSFRWRDLYTYGYVDNENVGVNYPFLNGVHYPYSNIVHKSIPEGTNYKQQVVNDPTIDDCE
jgi:hypothetical protein